MANMSSAASREGAPPAAPAGPDLGHQQQGQEREEEDLAKAIIARTGVPRGCLAISRIEVGNPLPIQSPMNRWEARDESVDLQGHQDGQQRVRGSSNMHPRPNAVLRIS
jgi:hypothetical protein